MKHNLLKSVIISAILLMGVSNAWALNSTFTKGEVLFIYTDNGDAAWTSSACVKLWFNDNGTGKGLASTQWLSDYDGNHKLFYAIVPGDGANKVQLQRFASNCSDWWNACGDALQSSRQKDAYNTFYSNGSNNNNFGWKNETFEMYLYGAPNKWASSLGTFVHQGNGVYKYTYRYKTTANSLEFKLMDSKSKWHGDNVSATELTVGKTYDLTGTVNLANGMTMTMEKSVVSFPVTFSPKGTFGSSKVTAQINSTPLTSGTNYESGQKIVFTASPASGYEIVGWYSDASCTSSLNNEKNTTYTIISLDAEVQVYVKFKETTHSVQVKSADINQGTVSPANVNAGQFTGVNITATPKIGYSFANWTATDGIIIANANSASTTITATKEGTVTANFEAQPATTVYLKTTANWKSVNARFAIYYWGANGQYGWVDMTEVDCNRDYFKGEIPYGCTGFNFVRMNPNTLENNWDNDWNKTGDLNIPNNNQNCFTITNDHWGEQNPTATGTWTAFNPTVNLTLKSSSNGTYKISYEGKTYESSLTENVVIRNLPLDAKIIISESATPNTGYKLLKRYIKLGTNEKVEATTNTPYTLCGSTTISANFVTILPHTVYLNITDYNWSNDGAKLAIYVYDETDQEGQGTWIPLTQVGSTKYYTATIPAGESNFNFVRLSSSTLNWNNKWNQTGNLAIPVTRSNTFKLTSFGTDGKDATGVWETGAAFSGDYRLAYVEQVVANGEGANNWKTVINNTTPSHTPDDIIRKRANGRDTISLFINVDGDNPEVILQQYDGSKWVDRETHMVTGPLKAGAGMAMINGRRNASADSNIDDFVYDDGIDAITESGVWNFVIVQDADGNNASLLLKEDGNDVTHKYTGNYYIRTDNAAGGWNTYTHSNNIMKPSTNPESGYSHYYCKWVKTAQPNVKFIVATDYSINVSKEFAKDDYTKGDGVLVENANVRWSWDENTGSVSRAYIQGAYNGQDRLNNIVLDYTTDGTNNPADVILDDSGDWIYTTDVDVRSGATLVNLSAQYPSQTISEVSPDTQHFITGPITILTGMSNEAYKVRVTYDFKNNKATTFLLPGEAAVATAVDVMIERVNQEDTKAVQSTIAPVNDQFTVCGVMSFTKDHLTNKGLHNDLRQFYWISFPFKVNLEDVYGFGVYGKHWILETYNGERRARDGLWYDSPSFWEYILDPKGVTLEANKGYLLCLDSELLSGTSDVFTNTNKVSLYFPAKTPTTGINTDYTTQVEIPSHVREDKRANRHIYDSNWNLIGVPSYANHTQTTETENLKYFYDYQYDNQTGKMIYAAKNTINTNEFQSMYAYFVQWGGTLNWSTFSGNNNTPAELAAKQNAAYEAQEHNLRLELQQDHKALDQTFVDMQEDGVTADFDLNKDMTKIINAGANIYTLAGEENIQLAGNSLPIANTTIPVGVQIAKAGEYTFAMPDGTDGITVEHIDYETNTRTNLLLSDYTVNLPAGTCETRFALSVKIDKTATSVENITEVEGANGEGVKKYIIDGKLFLQKDNTLYDAQGHIVR